MLHAATLHHCKPFFGLCKMALLSHNPNTFYLQISYITVVYNSSFVIRFLYLHLMHAFSKLRSFKLVYTLLIAS